MEFSLRTSSLKNSLHGSSSFNHHQSSSSTQCTNENWEENRLARHHRHHTHPVVGGFNRYYPMASPSLGHGEFIVKIDSVVDVDEGTNIHHTQTHDSRSTNSANTTSTTTSTARNNDNPGNSRVWNRESSGEFSFPRPNDNDNQDSSVSDDILVTNAIIPTLDHQNEKSETRLNLNLDIKDLQREQLQSPLQEQPQQGGLPPLPLIELSQSPNPSELHSNINSHNQNHHPNEGSKEIRVSFQESYYSDKLRRRTSIYNTIEGDSSPSTRDSSMSDHEDEHYKDHPNHSGEVLRRNSNANHASTRSFRGMPGVSRAKSRLWDPPATPMDQRSGGLPRSGPINRSGLLGKSMMDEDEDDPFFDDDLPDKFKRAKISPIVVLEWLSLVMIMGALICSLIIPTLREKKLWKLKLWKWEVLVLVLICGRLVSDWGIRILVFLIERNFMLRKRLLYFVYGLKKSVQNVIWLGLVLLTWHFLFDEKVEKQAQSLPIKVVTKILIVCEVGASLWLLKTLLVKFCASSFHVKAFFDRIQCSLFNQFVIETLSAPPVFELNQRQEEDEEVFDEIQNIQNAGIDVPHDLQSAVRNNSGAPTRAQCKTPVRVSLRHSEPLSKKEEEGITLDRLSKLNQKNVSAWNMKRLMKIIRYGGLTTLDEHLVDNSNHHEDDFANQIRSEVEAKAAARKIFQNVAKPGSRHIYLEDIMRFMKEDEAVRTMSLFEGADESDRINKRALKSWLVNAFRERRALALTLSDTKSVVNKLHKMMNVIVSGIILLIGIIWLNIITSSSVLFLSSQVFVVAFVFGNTCKNVFESIIFLFVIHPFDVGDRCEIDEVQMVVEEINILTTVFLRYDNQKIVFPNFVLITKPISNYYRSPDMGDAIELCFNISTPTEKIAVMRKRIQTYIENKREHWYPTPMIILKDVESLHMIRIAIWLQHRMNHQDMGERYTRRALLIEECVKIFREMDIEFRIYPVNVNVNSLPPLSYVQPPSPIRSSAFG